MHSIEIPVVSHINDAVGSSHDAARSKRGVRVARGDERAQKAPGLRIELQDFSGDRLVDILIGNQQDVPDENNASRSRYFVGFGVDAGMDERPPILARAVI